MAGKRTDAAQAGVFGDWFTRSLHARPFLRWAGGKQRFLFLHSKEIPAFHGNYLEPFLGGGSVFFHIARIQTRPFVARLGDINLHLIRCFADVRDQYEEVYDRLEVLQAGYSACKDKSEFYYEQRELHRVAHPKTDTARFIFLNRTCWNALWRENKHGLFNVPFGAPKSDRVIPTLEELRNASAALQYSKLRCTSWENTLALAEEGDFVFLDPPYFSDTLRGDPKYGPESFGLSDHEHLARTLETLSDRGIPFLLTSSAEPEMVALYQDHGFVATVISIPRHINSKADERQGVPELMVTGGSPRKVSFEKPAVLLDFEARRRTHQPMKHDDPTAFDEGSQMGDGGK